MKASRIMTKKVVTVTPDMDIHKLAALFVKKNISGAPVVTKSGQYLGVVLEEGLIFQDKRVHLPTFISILTGFLTLGENRLHKEIEKIAAATVAGIMEKNAKAVSCDTPVEEIATLMIEGGVHYLPVLEKGKVVGVVTKKDIVKAIAKGKL